MVLPFGVTEVSLRVCLHLQVAEAVPSSQFQQLRLSESPQQS
jgi:hypothetical protein